MKTNAYKKLASQVWEEAQLEGDPQAREALYMAYSYVKKAEYFALHAGTLMLPSSRPKGEAHSTNRSLVDHTYLTERVVSNCATLYVINGNWHWVQTQAPTEDLLQIGERTEEYGEGMVYYGTETRRLYLINEQELPPIWFTANWNME